MYVFTLVRKHGVICATCTCIYKVFTRHLNVECFESAVPAIFLSYAPTFFHDSKARVWLYKSYSENVLFFVNSSSLLLDINQTN